MVPLGIINVVATYPHFLLASRCALGVPILGPAGVLGPANHLPCALPLRFTQGSFPGPPGSVTLCSLFLDSKMFLQFCICPLPHSLSPYGFIYLKKSIDVILVEHCEGELMTGVIRLPRLPAVWRGLKGNAQPLGRNMVAITPPG